MRSAKVSFAITWMFAGLLSYPALADTIGDCRWHADGQVRLRACTSVISNAGLPPADRAEAYRRRGQLRLSAGATAEAIGDFTEAIALDPRDEQAWAGRGQAKLRRGDRQGSVADLSEALKLSPTSVGLLITRGHILLTDGKHQLAIKDFDTALSLQPTSIIALNNRGLAYRHAGNLQRAIEDYTAAIHLNPLYALAYNNRGYAHEALGNKGDAVADYRRALMIDPAMSGAREGLVRLKASGDLSAENALMRKRGLALAEKNCAWCHAIKEKGDSPNPKAPPFRSLQKSHPMLALREPLARGIAAPHDQMPNVSMSNEEIDAIIAYINGLPPG